MADRAAPEPDDDMHDPKDRGAPFPLGDFLAICDPCAGSPGAKPCFRQDFVDTDEKANLAQAAYGRVVRSAALLGLGALLIGLGQRLFGPRPSSSETPVDAWFVAESIYTAVALVFVLAAMLTRKQERWLSERLKAERLRLLKFKLLIDPRLWRADLRELEPWRNRLETERRVIVSQSETMLDALKISDSLPELPSTADCLAVEAPALRRLLEYYRRKRLGFQLGYFEEKMGQKLALANPRLAPIFFFLGVALVLCNDVLELAAKGTHSSRIEATSLVLVLASFAVPMGWSAIRTVRGAHEFSRNAARSQARHAALSEISQSLDRATETSPDRWDRPMIFGCLHLCEGILGSDQHEWMRLMKDAEWHG